MGSYDCLSRDSYLYCCVETIPSSSVLFQAMIDRNAITNHSTVIRILKQLIRIPEVFLRITTKYTFATCKLV